MVKLILDDPEEPDEDLLFTAVSDVQQVCSNEVEIFATELVVLKPNREPISVNGAEPVTITFEDRKLLSKDEVCENIFVAE